MIHRSDYIYIFVIRAKPSKDYTSAELRVVIGATDRRSHNLLRLIGSSQTEISEQQKLFLVALKKHGVKNVLRLLK